MISLVAHREPHTVSAKMRERAFQVIKKYRLSSNEVVCSALLQKVPIISLILLDIDKLFAEFFAGLKRLPVAIVTK